MKRRAFLWIALALSVSAFVASLIVSNRVFLRAPHNNDEFSYIFQAHNFLEGRIARPFPPNFHAFINCPRNSMIIMDKDVGWLSRYPSGHSLFLVIGLVMGDPYLASALAAGLCILLMCWVGRLTGGYGTGIIAGILLLISPFRLLYAGTLISHTSGVLMVCAMLAAYIKWRLENRYIFAVAAGLAWAFFVNNRTYTALLIALPFGLDAIESAWRERTPQRIAGVCCFAAFSILGAGLLLLYNRLALGEWMTMTYLFYAPSEALGFGLRRFDSIDHTFQRGIGMLVSQLVRLDLWLWGFTGSLIAWAGLLLIGWKRTWSRLCLAASLSVYLGYVYFWYEGATDAGPAYYYETLPFLALGASFGVKRLVDRLGLKISFAMLAVVVLFAGGLTARTAEKIKTRNMPRSRMLSVIRQAPPGSLIYIDPSDHTEAYRDGYRMIDNPRGLDGESIVALWIPEAHRFMQKCFPRHTPYKLIADDEGYCHLVPVLDDDRFDQPLIVRHDVLHAPRQTGNNENNPAGEQGGVRVAREGVHGAGYIFFGRHTFVSPGRYVFECKIKTETKDGERSGLKLDVAADHGRVILVERTVQADAGWNVVRLEFETTDFGMIEPRVWYAGTGSVFLASVMLKELDQDGSKY